MQLSNHIKALMLCYAIERSLPLFASSWKLAPNRIYSATEKTIH